VYQTVEACITKSLSTNNKIIWPRFPIRVGGFTLLKIPHAKKEVEVLKGLNICTWTSKNHDPRGIITKHFITLSMIPTFQNDPNEEEILFQGVRYYGEEISHVLNAQ
jgi:hypothetical protein